MWICYIILDKLPTIAYTLVPSACRKCLLLWGQMCVQCSGLKWPVCAVQWPVADYHSSLGTWSGREAQLASDGNRWQQMGTDVFRWFRWLYMWTDGNRWEQMGKNWNRGSLQLLWKNVDFLHTTFVVLNFFEGASIFHAGKIWGGGGQEQSASHLGWRSFYLARIPTSFIAFLCYHIFTH